MFPKQAANSLVTETSQYFVFFCRYVCSAILAKCLIINVLRLILVILFFIAFLNITYAARHTFATLQVELGTDIYTVQNMLRHANVTTTEIYARHADAKSKEASQKISLNLLKSVSSNKRTSENKNSNKENKTITSERRENKRKENHLTKH